MPAYVFELFKDLAKLQAKMIPDQISIATFLECFITISRIRISLRTAITITCTTCVHQTAMMMNFADKQKAMYLVEAAI